jgi:hypothetical protein
MKVDGKRVGYPAKAKKSLYNEASLQVVQELTEARRTLRVLSSRAATEKC